MASNCIYTGVPLTGKIMKEHILQCFTGANWMSNTIACNRVQEQFGRGCDRLMEGTFRFVRNLLGVGSGRPTSMRGWEMTSKDGHKFLLKNNEFRLREPVVEKCEDLGNGKYAVHMYVGSEKDLDWAKKKALEVAPRGCNKVDSYEMRPGVRDLSTEGVLTAHNVVLGGVGCLRGCLKSCFNLLGVTRHELAEDRQFDPLRRCLIDEPVEEPGSISMFARIVSEEKEAEVPKHGDFDHALCVYSQGRGVYGFLRLYGYFDFAMCLSATYVGEPFQEGYRVDPMASQSDKSDTFHYDVAKLSEFDLQDGEMRRESFNRYIESLRKFTSAYQKKSIVDEAVRRVAERHQSDLFIRPSEILTECEIELGRIIASLKGKNPTS